jgi:hypothetical protein
MGIDTVDVVIRIAISDPKPCTMNASSIDIIMYSIPPSIPVDLAIDSVDATLTIPLHDVYVLI